MNNENANNQAEEISALKKQLDDLRKNVKQPSKLKSKLPLGANNKSLQGTSNFGLGRMLNLNKSAEGTNLLPPQVGEFRIPFVSNLKMVRTELIDTQTYFTLSWDNVDLNNVSHYAVYVNNAGTPSNAPIGPYLAPRSPVRIAIAAPPDQKLVFRLQTVLNNGFQSNLDASPTATGITLG